MLPILGNPYRVLEPANMFASLRRDMDRLFDEAWSGQGGLRSRGWLPPVDIQETENEIRVEVEVPGLRSEDLEVTVENGVLTISGEKRYERKEGDEDRGQLVVERQYGRFTRSFTLPTQVDSEGVAAECSDGVLTLTLPKRSEARPKRIQVNAREGQGTRGQVGGGSAGRAAGGRQSERGEIGSGSGGENEGEGPRVGGSARRSSSGSSR